MGSGIATALILSNYPVILKEVNDKFLQAGIGRVRGEASIPCSDYNWDFYLALVLRIIWYSASFTSQGKSSPLYFAMLNYSFYSGRQIFTWFLFLRS